MTKTETETIPQLNWNGWAETTAATCNAPGEETRTCPNDAQPAQTRPIAQLTWGNWVITIQATPAIPLATGKRTCSNGDIDIKDDLAICGTNLSNVFAPEEQFCQDGTVKELCGTATYTATQFCDTREGKPYKFETIGTQTWMAENLNYNASGSKCYNNDPANCTTYGRHYDWSTAMDLESSCNNRSDCSQYVIAKHRGICPTGWHIPSDAEWTILALFAGGTGTYGHTDGTAGNKLKANSNLWLTNTGTDDFGFSALPVESNDFGYSGSWWSANENGSNAYFRRIYGSKAKMDRENWGKDNFFSVRCVQD